MTICKRFLVLTLASCLSSVGFAQEVFQVNADTILVPIAGNTWRNNLGDNKILQQGNAEARRNRGNTPDDHLDHRGILQWNARDISFTTYVWMESAALYPFEWWAEVKVDKPTQIRFSFEGQHQLISSSPSDYKWIKIGKFIPQRSGYHQFSCSNLTSDGLDHQKSNIAIRNYKFIGAPIKKNWGYVPNNQDNFFYWGRRGPSVHLSYTVPDTLQAEWFYNEVTLPADNEVIGSYYMANGFGEGYFGMQVNGPTERRILFSVWSPFHTDDPKQIPEDQKIILLKKGPDVQTGEFGNEGAGGQSFLRYPWKAGTTYKFLLHGRPLQDGYTVYTAYFFAPEENSWRLIASFKRPKTQTWLKRFHSFLENFIPEQGDQVRWVQFGNQWVKSSQGTWFECTSARFSYDNTAAKGYRLDYAGGITGEQFFLKNAGFFSGPTKSGQVWQRKAQNHPPVIPWDQLWNYSKSSISSSSEPKMLDQ